MNETSSPEVEELMEAFKAMSTVVKAANINLRSGDLQIAEKNYVDALILFKKLENERGVRLHTSIWERTLNSLAMNFRAEQPCLNGLSHNMMWWGSVIEGGP